MLAITLTAPPLCSQVSISIPKTHLSLCAQVINWCLCARVFFCPVGKACLALFGKDGVIVTRCRLFGGGHPVEATPWSPPHTHTPRKRLRLTLGLGTNAAKRAIKSSGSKTHDYAGHRWCRHSRVFLVGSAPCRKSLLPTFFLIPQSG